LALVEAAKILCAASSKWADHIYEGLGLSNEKRELRDAIRAVDLALSAAEPKKEMQE
jgi:hypothetical protein